jgi:hypothetical protein
MPKRLKKDARPKDVNQLAHHIVRLSTEGDDTPAPKPPKGLSAYMSALGKRGGQGSGARRMTNLSDEQREAIALKAARARWAKAKQTKKHWPAALMSTVSKTIALLPTPAPASPSDSHCDR